MEKPFINEKVLKEFEPIYTKAEMEIKGLIRQYVIENRSQVELVEKINESIKRFRDRLPKELPNHDVFIQGLMQSANKWVIDFKRKIDNLNAVLIFAINKQKEVIVISEQSSVVENLKKAIRYQGVPNVDNYRKELANAVNQLATTPMVDNYEPGKRRISVFARAELELRYKNQTEMVERLRNNGETLRRFSSHQSASERCEPWQGKLVDLLLPPINQQMETGTTYKGEKIYSYSGITNKVDKYGYKNNIIVGWNCRHKMLDPDYKDNIEEYTKAEIDKGREINAKQRDYERRIREARKSQYLALTKQDSLKYKQKAKELTNAYEQYSKDNQVAMAKWRLHIPMTLREVANY